MASKKKLVTAEPVPERLSRGRVRDGASFPAAPAKLGLPSGYASTLQDIKAHLRSARLRAVLAANPIVIEAYWHTGSIILQRQSESAWGAKVIDRLAADLREEFPDGPIAQQPVAQLPWGHILQIMQRLKDPAARDYYIREAAEQGWSSRTASSSPGKTSCVTKSNAATSSNCQAMKGATMSPSPFRVFAQHAVGQNGLVAEPHVRTLSFRKWSGMKGRSTTNLKGLGYGG